MKDKDNKKETSVFIKEFFSDPEYSEYKVFNIFHKLIPKLINEHKRPWTVKSLQNYIDKLYIRADAVNKESDYQNGGLSEAADYKILNTSLFDKDKNKIFFIAVLNETIFSPLLDTGFFTISELENKEFSNKKYIIEECKKTKNVHFETIKYNTREISEKINFHYEETEDKVLEKYKNYSIEFTKYLCSKNHQEKVKKVKKPIKPNERLKGWHHIIIDGINNFPIEFLNQYFSERLFFLGTKEKIRLQNKLIQEDAAFDNLKEILEAAITETLKLFTVRKNLIAPSYFPKTNEMSYLLPIYLTDSEHKKPDFVFLFNIKSDQDIIEEINIDGEVTELLNKYEEDEYLTRSSNNKVIVKRTEKEIEEKNRKDFIEYLNQGMENEAKESIVKLFETHWKKRAYTKDFEDVKNDFETYIDKLYNKSNKINNNRYIAKTLLNLDEAYINLRLLNEENHYHWLF